MLDRPSTSAEVFCLGGRYGRRQGKQGAGVGVLRDMRELEVAHLLADLAERLLLKLADALL
jgi:hypothetical protein